MVRCPLIAALLLPAALAHADEARLATMVLHTRAESFDAKLGDVVQSGIVAGLAEDPGRRVLSVEDLRRTLEAAELQALSGCDAPACAMDFTAALNADRLVLSRLWRLKRDAFVVISELDARTLAPIAQVEEVVTPERGALTVAVAALTARLVGAARQGSPTARRGVLLVESKPAGALVRLYGQTRGTTPLQLDDVAAGEHPLEVELAGAQHVIVRVPVFEGQATRASVEFGGTVPVSAEAVANYWNAALSNEIVTNIGFGGWLLSTAVNALPVALLTIASIDVVRSPTADPVACLGISVLGLMAGGVGLVGCASGALGLGSLFFRPEPPQPKPAPHRVHIVPPVGLGSATSVEIPANVSPSGARP